MFDRLDSVQTERVFDMINNHEDLSKDDMSKVLKDVMPYAAEFQEKLDKYVEDKEVDIQQICVDKYRNLVDALNVTTKIISYFERAKVKVAKLQNDIHAVNFDISGQFKSHSDLSRRHKNIRSTIEYIQGLKNATNGLKKAQTQITSLRHLSAIRTLNTVTTHTKGDSGYSQQLIQSFVPKFTDIIVQQVEGKLNDWLVDTRVKAEEIGKSAFQLIVDRENYEKHKKERMKKVESYFSTPSKDLDMSPHKSRELHSFQLSRLSYMKTQNQVSIRTSTVPSLMRQRSKDFVAPKSKAVTQDLPIDFTALYQCEMIFKELKRAQDYRTKLKISRRAEILQSSQIRGNVREGLEVLAGHILIEREIWRNNEKFRSEEEMQSLWIETLVNLERSLQVLIQGAPTHREILEVKTSTMLFSKAMQKAGLSQRAYTLYEILRTNYQQFMNKLLEDYVELAENVVRTDSYLPIALKNPGDFDKYASFYGIKVEQKNDYLPYSLMVPNLCDLVRQSIASNHSYIEGLQDFEVDKIHKLTDNLLHRINQVMVTPLREANVLQSAMFSINASYMYQAFGNFYKLLEKMIGGCHEFSARKTYLELKDKWEVEMYQHLKSKIRDFLNMISQTMIRTPQVSEYCDAFLMYVEHIVSSLEEICGYQTSSTALHIAFSYLAHGILEKVSQLSGFNKAFIEQLEIELAYMKQFVTASAVCGKVPGIIESLSEIEQFINIFTPDGIQAYCERTQRSMRFSKVDPGLLLSILSKYKDTKNCKPKKSDFKSLIKKLIAESK